MLRRLLTTLGSPSATTLPMGGNDPNGVMGQVREGVAVGEDGCEGEDEGGNAGCG